MQIRYGKAIQKANEELAANRKKEDSTAHVKEVEGAYQRLIKAQSEYVTAMKDEDSGRMSYWQAEIDSAKGVLDAYRKQVSQMNITDEAKAKIERTTADATQAEGKHAAAVEKTRKQMQEQDKAVENTERNIRNVVTEVERWVAQMLIMRGLTNMWRDMTEYAASYYDAMNEIRIVTG